MTKKTLTGQDKAILRRAAQALDAEADCIAESNTIDRDMKSFTEFQAKEDHDKLRILAQLVRGIARRIRR